MKKLILIFSMLLIMLPSIQIAHPADLVLTTTLKESYNLGENIIINGTLTLNGSPVQDGLVAIQINTPRGDNATNRFVTRVLTTGSEPSGPWQVEILEAYSCDLDGNPKTSFRRGGDAGFQVTVRNNGASNQYVIVTINLYDSSGIVFANLLMINETIGPGGSFTSRRWVEEVIPTDASIGTAHLYAVALTNWPQYGGVAWCPEESSTFSITTGSGGAGIITSEDPKTPSISTTPGTFSTSFRLSANGGILGNYTMHVTSWYDVSFAINHKSFEAILIADINEDGTVDMADLSIIIDAFMSTPGSGNWNPAADIIKDNSVDMTDISFAIEEFLKWGRY
jgi:hypothetical protein